MPKKFRNIRHIKLYSAILLAVIVVSALFLILHTHNSHSPNKIITAGTPVTLPQAKSTGSQSTGKTLTNNNAATANSGGATDTHGSSAVSTNSNQWVTSASGNITVKNPAANSMLKPGDIVTGAANVGEVQYRLNDNKVGVIAQGTLSVVNGNFSGVLHFQPQGTGGRLDIFSTDSQGVEYNEVQINVSF